MRSGLQKFGISLAALIFSSAFALSPAFAAGKAGRIGQHFVGDAARPLRLHQRRDQRDRVIGKRRGARGVLAEALEREREQAGRSLGRFTGKYSRTGIFMLTLATEQL